MGIRLFLLLLLSVGVLSVYDPYRLPDIYRPQHYDLRILTHLNGSDQLHFEGQVMINLQVLVQTRNITLNAKNLTIDPTQITLTSERGSNRIENAEFNDDKEFYILHLSEDLQQSDQYNLTIPFKGPLNRNETGYYRSSFNDLITNQTQ